ncbi:MAG: DUF2273 domain-containing protein [Clostridiales bacterium]|nr:DUF2273 domain-containing protein [Clostridiales bacterium]
MKGIDKHMHEWNKPGNPVRKLIYAGAFFVFGLMLIYLGFWKTLLVAALTAAGYFIGASDNLEDSARKLINKLFPPSSKKVTYGPEDMEKVKKALDEKKNEAKQEPAQAASAEPKE